MKLNIATKKGQNIVFDNIKAILVHFDSGEFQVLENHIPIIAATSKGYLKVEGSDLKYLALERATFEFQNNEANVIASQVAVSSSLEEANAKMLEEKEALIKKSKTDEQKFVQLEQELKSNILKAKASKI